jgi:hypothetical protein
MLLILTPLRQGSKKLLAHTFEAERCRTQYRERSDHSFGRNKFVYKRSNTVIQELSLDMRNKIILCLKTAWIVAAFMIVLTATAVCGSADQACSAAADTMLLFMSLLSFPLGLVFLLISSLFVAPSAGPASDYAFTWFIMLCGGSCQWFILVPRLFAPPQFTVLNLRTPPNAISRSLVAPPAPTPKPPEAAIETIAVSRPSVRSRKPPNRTRPFDRLGRTPLERVINR